jgi:hypothetical protein
VSIEINLNGGIVANKGFIRQMATPGTKIINSKYVSAWGGIQAAGQTIGQIVRHLPNCRYIRASANIRFLLSFFNMPLKNMVERQLFTL